MLLIVEILAVSAIVLYAAWRAVSLIKKIIGGEFKK